MKRREFLKLTAVAAAVAAVPAIALARKARNADVLTFEMVAEVQRLFNEAEVPEPRYAIINENIMKDFLKIEGTTITPNGAKMEGITLIPMERPA